MENNRINLKAIYIEITEKCNLHCLHCYNDSGNGNHELEESLLLKLIDDASQLNVETFSISGGEPLLSKSFIPVLTEICKNHISNINIITNGHLLDKKMLENILSINKNVNFQLSFDGIGQSNDIIRGKGSYERLINAINLLKEYNCSFVFHSLIHRDNFNQLNEMIEFSSKQGAKQIDFSFLKRKGRGKNNFDTIALSCDEMLTCLEQDIADAIIGMNIEVNFPKVFFGSCPLFEDARVNVFARIDSWGNVYPCQNFAGDFNILGNLHNESIKEIITEKRFDNLKQRFLNHSKLEKCKICFLNSICNKGCPGIEYSDYDDIGESFECQVRKKYAISKIESISSLKYKGGIINEDTCC